MAYLACMIIGSLITIASACICAIGNDDKDDKPETLIVRDGSIIYEFIETTGEVINIYYLRESNEIGEFYERRTTK